MIICLDNSLNYNNNCIILMAKVKESGMDKILKIVDIHNDRMTLGDMKDGSVYKMELEDFKKINGCISDIWISHYGKFFPVKIRDMSLIKYIKELAKCV